MNIASAIYGCAGLELDDAEKRFFREARPWGFILFARNVSDPEQLRRLTSSLRETVGRDAPILIDQEGGRVQRLRPPHWRAWPAARSYGEIHERDPERAIRAAELGAELMAAELRDVGITVDCLPVLDVRASGAHEVIGDRAYGGDPDIVTALGRAAAEGLLAGGVVPVVKHMPGHGRAGADSHKHLPVVDAPLQELEARDFAPFRALRHLPLAMTAHVVYTALDPDNPATLSKTVIGDAIRGAIGFDGLLMSDDLSMKALKGSFGARTKAAFAGGCDLVLHCNGGMAEMEAVAAEAGALTGESLVRSDAALAKHMGPSAPLDIDSLWAEFSEITGFDREDRWG